MWICLVLIIILLLLLISSQCGSSQENATFTYDDWKNLRNKPQPTIDPSGADTWSSELKSNLNQYMSEFSTEKTFEPPQLLDAKVVDSSRTLFEDANRMYYKSMSGLQFDYAKTINAAQDKSVEVPGLCGTNICKQDPACIAYVGLRPGDANNKYAYCQYVSTNSSKGGTLLSDNNVIKSAPYTPVRTFIDTTKPTNLYLQTVKVPTDQYYNTIEVLCPYEYLNCNMNPNCLGYSVDRDAATGQYRCFSLYNANTQLNSTFFAPYTAANTWPTLTKITGTTDKTSDNNYVTPADATLVKVLRNGMTPQMANCAKTCMNDDTCMAAVKNDNSDTCHYYKLPTLTATPETAITDEFGCNQKCENTANCEYYYLDEKNNNTCNIVTTTQKCAGPSFNDLLNNNNAAAASVFGQDYRQNYLYLKDYPLLFSGKENIALCN